jgi:hypothetical protein
MDHYGDSVQCTGVQRFGPSVVALVLVAACSSGSPAGDPSRSTTASTSIAIQVTKELEPDHVVRDDVVVIDVDAPGTPIDPRLLGTNVPAWLGPERFRAAWLREALVDAGITTIRMPGGSWSNEYGWSACELRLEEGCIWEGAARPSDFANLLAETGLEGIWTVSINETAESAAALVAFFNGDVDDQRVVGTDRHGVDWGTVADWAKLRATGGHLEPVPIRLWEVGNEVYGGRPDTGGEECAAFGWESVWTCDGTDYVLGDDDHDGYLDIRRAMLEVDPTIEVGAVGVGDPESWSNWGNEVIDASGDSLDFYVVHQYGFDSSPSPDAVAHRAAELWPPIVEELRETMGPDVPIAITEYNLVSFEAGDTERSMTTVANALFIADSIGRLAEHGVEIANQWNLANGTTASGTDYGMVAVDTGERFPQFEAMAAWGRAGDVLLPLDGGELGGISAYPTRRPDGTMIVILLNPTVEDRELTVSFAGFAERFTGTAVSRTAASSDAATFQLRVPVDIVSTDGDVPLRLPPWSITELELMGRDRPGQ